MRHKTIKSSTALSSRGFTAGSRAFLFILLIGINNNCIASCSTPLQLWGSAEYLYWWTQGSPIGVPLVTTSNDPSSLAILNQPGTQIIFGSGSNNNSLRLGGSSGLRITLGTWIGDNQQNGLEFSGFGFSQYKSTFRASSTDGTYPVVSIPFFSTQDGKESVITDHPNTVTVSDVFKPAGFELNYLYNLSNQIHFPLVLITGFQYLNFNEHLSLNDAITGLPALPPNSVLNVQDNFSTKNLFYGIDLGVRSQYCYKKISLDVAATLGLGKNYQKLTISGQTNVDNQTLVQSMGLFAEPSNIGTFRNNLYAVVPELKVKLSYHLNRALQPFITYNGFFINKAIRPGNQIDRNINLSQNPLFNGSGTLVGPAFPMVRFKNCGMWMQGIGAGIEFNIF